MLDLLLNPEITISITKAYPAIEKVFHQIMLDTANNGDDEKTLQVLKGLYTAKDTLLLFAKEGENDLEKEKR